MDSIPVNMFPFTNNKFLNNTAVQLFQFKNIVIGMQEYIYKNINLWKTIAIAQSTLLVYLCSGSIPGGF